MSTVDIEVLVSWSELAEQCNLHRLRLCCARQLALALASSPRYNADGTCYSTVNVSTASKKDVVSVVSDAAPLKTRHGGTASGCFDLSEEAAARVWASPHPPTVHTSPCRHIRRT